MKTHRNLCLSAFSGNHCEAWTLGGLLCHDWAVIILTYQCIAYRSRSTAWLPKLNRALWQKGFSLHDRIIQRRAKGIINHVHVAHPSDNVVVKDNICGAILLMDSLSSPTPDFLKGLTYAGAILPLQMLFVFAVRKTNSRAFLMLGKVSRLLAHLGLQPWFSSEWEKWKLILYVIPEAIRIKLYINETDMAAMFSWSSDVVCGDLNISFSWKKN